jgi:hypothetical protein
MFCPCNLTVIRSWRGDVDGILLRALCQLRLAQDVQEDDACVNLTNIGNDHQTKSVKAYAQAQVALAPTTASFYGSVTRQRK